MWLNQNFLLGEDVFDWERDGCWRVTFRSLRDNSILQMSFEVASGTMVVATEHISLAADIVQSLAAYLNLDHLKVSYNPMNLPVCHRYLFALLSDV